MPRKPTPILRLTPEMAQPRVLLTPDIAPLLRQKIAEEEAARQREIEEAEYLARTAPPPLPRTTPSRVKRGGSWVRPIKSIGRGMTRIDGVILTKYQIEQFWSQVRKTDNPDECWVWTGECLPSGHGTFRAQYKKKKTAPPRRAARFAYMLTHDQVERGVCILHKCGLAPCCNPRHLYEGDYKKNYEDMLVHREMARKLTEQDKEDIKKSNLGMVDLAQKYEVTTGIIWVVKFGKPREVKGRWWEWF